MVGLGGLEPPTSPLSVLFVILLNILILCILYLYPVVINVEQFLSRILIFILNMLQHECIFSKHTVYYLILKFTGLAEHTLFS